MRPSSTIQSAPVSLHVLDGELIWLRYIIGVCTVPAHDSTPRVLSSDDLQKVRLVSTSSLSGGMRGGPSWQQIQLYKCYTFHRHAVQADRSRILMPTEPYRLPNFLALLPKKPGGKINPHFKQVGAAFDAWVQQRFGGPIAVDVFKCENPMFAAMTYPLASSLQLEGITNYSAAAFLFDDVIDRAPIEDVPAISQSWMNILRDGSEAESVDHPVIEMIRSDLFLGMKAAVGSFHWSQFVAKNEITITEMMQEARERKEYLSSNGMTLDLQSYIIKRRQSSGVRPYLVFAQCTRHLYIPDNVLAHSLIQKMENAALDLVTISNDIYSFEKEYSFDRAFTNVLTVIENDPETAHLNFQQRIDYAEKLFDVTLEQFHACRRELPSFGPEMGECLAHYADGLVDLIIGTMEWSYVVPRYHMFMNEEDRKANVLRLALDGSPENQNASVPVY